MDNNDFYNRISFYISSLTPDNSSLCEKVGEDARERGVPVIRREAESFLKMLLALKKPERILEIGTAVGYSTLIMAENTPDDCIITTIEIGEEDARRAEENFREAGILDHVWCVYNKSVNVDTDTDQFCSGTDACNDSTETSGKRKRIRLVVGDAADVFPKLDENFDFVFLDASKGQYLKFFNEVRRLLSPGAVVVSDNVLQGGDVLKPHFIIEQRDRTVHRRMRDFLFAITHDEDFVTSIVPVGDGMAVSVFREEKYEKT